MPTVGPAPDVEPPSESERVPAAERAVIETTARAIAASDVGLDDDALGKIRDALRRVVPFDRHFTPHPEGEDGKAFRILWRDGDDPALRQVAFETGIHSVQVSLESRGAGPGEPRIATDIDPEGTPIERALYRASVRSYVSFPLVHRGI